VTAVPECLQQLTILLVLVLPAAADGPDPAPDTSR
jgi:hypothetical protein